jgi:hypothetical protein
MRRPRGDGQDCDGTNGAGSYEVTCATIKRSILLPGASVGDEAHLEDCIVIPYPSETLTDLLS